MNDHPTPAGMLDLLIQPGFCVKENRITSLNAAARGLLFAPGQDIRDLLETGLEEYRDYTGGCLYLQLRHMGNAFGASVCRMGDTDVFVLEPGSGNQALQTLALASMELRQPLHGIMIAADKLQTSDDASAQQLARLNRSVYQLHRILNNMADAGGCTPRMEIRNLREVFSEIFEKAAVLVESTGKQLAYTGPREDIFGLADRELLQRAVLNLLSNALKFTPEGGVVEAVLRQKGQQLQLCIRDNGSGIPEELLGNVFTRYLRSPGIEDSRHGLGLGMVLIRSAAAAHGGAVLIDRPESSGTRITMTMAVRQGNGSSVRTPIDLPGGQDAGLLELSDCLPVSLYEK